MARDFQTWLSTFKDSIADWNYYTNFEKVYKNVKDIKIELNLINSLIGSNDIESDFRSLLSRYPEVLKVVPILLAVRQNEIKVNTIDDYKKFSFSAQNYTIDEYCAFMRETGLFELLEKHIISDLEDYVIGIEVGLDSNARKNRTGTTMENLVEDYLIKLGYIKGKTYFPQMKASNIKKYFNIDVTDLDNKKKTNKRFDFVVKTANNVYAIEVNFYSGGGSKLNETANSYKMIAQESKNIEGFHFIWITDGTGWFKAKNSLEETFLAHENVFNLNDLKTGLLKKTIT